MNGAVLMWRKSSVVYKHRGYYVIEDLENGFLGERKEDWVTKGIRK
jgi:hypothetical protein